MEKFRAIKYEAIGLSDTDVTAVVGGSYGSTYTGQTFYKTDTAASTTLSAAMTTTTQKTVPVQASPTGFPSAGPFIVKIDNEYMLISNRATSTWTLYQATDRGLYGTTAATHSSGATVYWIQRVNVAACGSSPCTNAVATKTVTGADGRGVQGGYVHHLAADQLGGVDGRPARQAREHRRPRQHLPVQGMGAGQRLLRRVHGHLASGAAPPPSGSWPSSYRCSGA